MEQTCSGYAVTGGQDAVVNIFNLENPREEPDFCLVGHSENICTLDVTPDSSIISGSWDKYAASTEMDNRFLNVFLGQPKYGRIGILRTI